MEKPPAIAKLPTVSAFCLVSLECVNESIRVRKDLAVLAGRKRKIRLKKRSLDSGKTKQETFNGV